MAPRTFVKGEKVFVTAPHLQGIRGEVLLKQENLYFVRVSEHQFEGHIVAFEGTQLAPVTEETKK